MKAVRKSASPVNTVFGGALWVPIAERIFATFGDSDAKVAFLVPGPAPMAERLLEQGSGKYSVFLDPDRAVIASLGLERLPALVHLRQDTALANVAEGWDPKEWQRVVRAIGKAMAWTYPEISRPGDPPPTPGWPAVPASSYVEQAALRRAPLSTFANWCPASRALERLWHGTERKLTEMGKA